MSVPLDRAIASATCIPHPRQEPDMTTIDKTGASDSEFQARVDRFDAAPPAPESFDAAAALRRVEALADHMGGSGSSVYRKAAKNIRAALSAPLAGQHITDEEGPRAIRRAERIVVPDEEIGENSRGDDPR